VHPRDAAPTPQARAGVPVAVPLLAGHLQPGLELRWVRHRDLQEQHRVVGRDPVAQALLVGLAVRTAQPCASSRTRTSWWLTWCRWAAPAATAVAPGAGRSTAVSWRLRAQAIAAGRAGLVDQLGVGQVQRRGSGVVQPGVAAAYPDQPLVQPVDAPAEGRAGPERREGGADGVVTARPVLLDAAEPLLVAGVDRRRAPTVSRMASAWARCRWSSSWLASTFHAMDESAVPARYKIRVRGILSETLLGAFPGLHAQARGSQTVRLLWGRRSSTCGSAADALMDMMSGSTMAARISVPTAAAEDRRGTAAPCG
jgi:hypothetical protein